jgi:hypothetical protein
MSASSAVMRRVSLITPVEIAVARSAWRRLANDGSRRGNRLLPRRVHRASRTQPASTQQPGPLLRPAVRGQFPDLIGGRSRSKTPRAEIGFVSILHSWGSNLLLHPHVHCVVPAGGFSPDHQPWIHTHPRFLLPIPVLRRVFRDKFLFALKRLYSNGSLDCSGPAAVFQDRELFAELLNQLRKKKWIVYAKPPFGGPAHVLRYLGRYTHRIAISNHRLLAFDGKRVSLRWKDYAHGGKQRIMTLAATEFLRRFFLHVLPRGFVRIRHFGLLSNRFPSHRLLLARKLLAREGRDQLPLPAQTTSAANAPLWHGTNCGGPMGVARSLTAAELSLLRQINSS